MYLASVDDNAVAFCLELDHEMRLENMKNAYPEILCRSVWSVAQSTSLYPTLSVHIPFP